MEKANSTVKWVNYIFCLLSMLTAILQMSLINVTESEIIFISGTVTLETFAAIILIVSIQSLRKFIKNSEMKRFVMNERLMIIHTGLYCSFIAAYSM